MAKNDHNVSLIEQSQYFDADFYLQRYPDVRGLGMTPAEHYLRWGARLGRDPSPHFSTEEYVSKNPGVKISRTNPLVHFLTSDSEPAPVSVRSGGEEAAPRVQGLFISGEAIDKPGFFYRVERYATSFQKIGVHTKTIPLSHARENTDFIKHSAFVFLWRAAWSQDVELIIDVAKKASVPIIFDIDDLMIRADLAEPQYIDAIRFDKKDKRRVSAHYEAVTRTMVHCSYGTASTDELAWQMRLNGRRRPTLVLPNGFSKATYQISRTAAEAWRKRHSKDDLVRIGYASGSRTHQEDFRACAAALADILRENPNARLVLFQKNELKTLDTSEFPEFRKLESQIEWRPFKKHSELPIEMARFDINLAPLQYGNPFCEAKSELKYFEAAICDIPTVASPTGPFRRAIKHGTTGFLANDRDEWKRFVGELVSDEDLRRRVGKAAHRDVLWEFGPTRRVELSAHILRMLAGGREASGSFHAYNASRRRPFREIEIPAFDVHFDYDSGEAADVSIIIPLFNYENYVLESLNSAKDQTLQNIEIIVVDDKSTDHSLEVVNRWMNENHGRFTRAVLVSHRVNSGLGASRNTAFDLANSLYIMALDADNLLRKNCCEVCLSFIEEEGAAFSYPTIQQFGDSNRIMGNRRFHPADFIPGNGIDAMAMISKEAWALVGGYVTHRLGWQDYDFWCRIVGEGLHGVHVPDVLADYRVHQSSMLRTATDKARNKAILVDRIEQDHEWTSLTAERDGHRSPLKSATT